MAGGGGWRDKFKDGEVKPHYSEERKNKVVEGEIDNDNNGEYV